MDLGNKILKFRKINNLSQEQLAEKLDISRQTISKWELNETAPDLTQAKKISKIFKVSLDELVDNDVKDILTEKISNTERLSGITIKILKIFGILLVVAFIFLIYKIMSVSTYAWFIEEKSYNCYIGEEKYAIEIRSYDGVDGYENNNNQNYWNCKNCSYEQLKEIKNFINYDDLNETELFIKAYFKSLGGKCN